MRVKQWVLFIFLTALLIIPFVSVAQEKLTEEQMTAYRTRPAVVLVYSGMFVEITLKGQQTFKVPNYGSGSGFFINPEGYLVTNGHVVDTYVKYMEDKNGYSQQVFNNFIMQRIVNEFKQSRGREPSEREIRRELSRFEREYEPKISNHGAINYVVLSNNEYMNFEVKKFSPSVPDGGKDIAVLKVERDNCPVIMLGDSTKLALQQQVFTIGFPAVVDPQRFPLLGKDNTLKASITRGSISALKTDFKGMSVIQHDSATSPGNSGGPTVDIKGRVIGVHSYAAAQYDGFKFCVPINTAKEFIRDAGIEFNKESEFTKVFNQLMDAVWNKDWFEARSLVSTALAYMESEPDLKRMQQMILTRIRQMGFFEKVWLQNQLVVIIGIALVVLIIIVLIFALRPSPEKKVEMPPMAVPVEKPAAPEPVVEDATVAEPETPTQALDATVFEDDLGGTVTVLEKGEEIGTFDVLQKGVLVGRDPKAVDVYITSSTVSKTHCKITPQEGWFFIEDLGSTNGTFVNNERIDKKQLSALDRVQLGKKGDIKLVLRKKE